jgi:uncharacterized membrane protein HdeD (DUF308 family)
MFHALAQNWWLILLKGICAIIFGVLALAWPGLTIFTLVLLYGVYALVDGIFALTAAATGDTAEPRWWLAIVGIIGIGAGILTFLWPNITAFVLLFLIAFWAIAMGIAEIVGAIRLRKEIDNEWLLAASGVISVLFGLLLLSRPAAGALALITVIGAFAIVHGVLLAWFALKVHWRDEAAV